MPKHMLREVPLRMQGMQHLNLNSGMFYVKANQKGLKLMEATASDLQANPKKWDQATLNDQLFTLSHGEYLNPGCSVRVMESKKFMNSKVSPADSPLHAIAGSGSAYDVHVFAVMHLVFCTAGSI